jgi:catechol 2,3-dioxygenase-like lactoylglutathione lyase family enzyme
MIKLDHFTILVSNYAASRDWYTSCFGLRVAFEDPASGVGGLEDDAGVELIYEGIHFRVDQEAGSDLGDDAGTCVYRHNLRRANHSDNDDDQCAGALELLPGSKPNRVSIQFQK